MGFKDLKIQETDFAGKDVASLPDRVTGQAAFLKARFDSIGKDVLTGRVNSLLDGLDGTGAAAALGFKETSLVKASNVQDAVEKVAKTVNDLVLEPAVVPEGSVSADKLTPGLRGELEAIPVVRYNIAQLQLERIVNGGSPAMLAGAIEGFGSADMVDTAGSSGMTLTTKNNICELAATSDVFEELPCGTGLVAPGSSYPMYWNNPEGDEVLRLEVTVYGSSESSKAPSWNVKARTGAGTYLNLQDIYFEKIPGTYNWTGVFDIPTLYRQYSQFSFFCYNNLTSDFYRCAESVSGNLQSVGPAVSVRATLGTPGTATYKSKAFPLGLPCDRGELYLHYKPLTAGSTVAPSVRFGSGAAAAFGAPVTRSITLGGRQAVEARYSFTSQTAADSVTLSVAGTRQSAGDAIGLYALSCACW